MIVEFYLKFNCQPF